MNRLRLGWALVSVLIALTFGSVATAALVSAYTATQIRGTQVNNTLTLDNTEETLRVLVDCTDPAGGCYRRGQKSQAAAIDDITRVSIYAAACADRPREQTAQEIQDCILEQLDAEQRTR